MKICSTCKIAKDYVEYTKNKIRADGYQNQCKQCNKEWRIANSEYYKKVNRKFRTNNVEYFKQYNRQHYLNNIEYIKQHSKEWSQTEKGKLSHKTTNHKRRSLINDNTPTDKHFTPADIILKLKLQHGKCVYCKKPIKKCYQIDHFIPLTKGGSNEASNIQLLCKKCNGASGKWDKMPQEFAQQHGMLV